MGSQASKGDVAAEGTAAAAAADAAAVKTNGQVGALRQRTAVNGGDKLASVKLRFLTPKKVDLGPFYLTLNS